MPKGSTSYKDTKFGIVPRSKLVKLEIEGVKKGLEFIYKLSVKNKKIKITPELIKKIHRISFGWIFPKWAGKFRTIQVTFSEKEAPSYFKINELVINLCLDLDEQIKHLPIETSDKYLSEIIKLLAQFQHRFVFIHPFNDYSGRTARLLTTLLLLNFRLPLIEIKSSTKLDRKKYIRAMQEADEGNYSNLEKLIATALEEGLQKFDK